MKHLIFILLGFFIWNSALSQTRTSNFQLPQWSTGDTLKAGTANDTTRANFSLNNGFARLDAILGARIDSTGRFIDILGAGTGNLIINSGSLGVTATRISLADSLYGTFNWQTTANLLVGGNATIGGYIVADSLIGGQLTIDSLSVRALRSSGDALIEGSNGLRSWYGLTDGIAGTRTGTLHLENAGSTGEPSGTTLLPIEDDFNDSLWMPRTTQSAGNDTLVIMNGEQTLYDGLFFAGQSGIATVGAGDSVQVTYSGFTSNGIVMLNYVSGNTAFTKIPVVGYRRTNGFTIYADASYTVAWFVVKK